MSVSDVEKCTEIASVIHGEDNDSLEKAGIYKSYHGIWENSVDNLVLTCLT